MKRLQFTFLASLVALSLSLVTAPVLAQQDHGGHDQSAAQGQGRSQGQGSMQQEGAGGGMMNHEGGDGGGMGGGMMMQRMQQMISTMQSNQLSSGQSAFELVSQIVKRLEANPETDWATINIEALRQHLVDMNQVTLYAEVETTQVEGGAQFVVTGDGRTREAIKRMVPTHASQVRSALGWGAQTESRRNGITLTVTSDDAAQVAKIRGLGFLGFMVLGDHHEGHHLMIAGAPMDDHSGMDHGDGTGMNHGGQGGNHGDN